MDANYPTFDAFAQLLLNPVIRINFVLIAWLASALIERKTFLSLSNRVL